MMLSFLLTLASALSPLIGAADGPASSIRLVSMEGSTWRIGPSGVGEDRTGLLCVDPAQDSGLKPPCAMVDGLHTALAFGTAQWRRLGEEALENARRAKDKGGSIAETTAVDQFGQEWIISLHETGDRDSGNACAGPDWGVLPKGLACTIRPRFYGYRLKMDGSAVKILQVFPNAAEWDDAKALGSGGAPPDAGAAMSQAKGRVRQALTVPSGIEARDASARRFFDPWSGDRGAPPDPAGNDGFFKPWSDVQRPSGVKPAPSFFDPWFPNQGAAIGKTAEKRGFFKPWLDPPSSGTTEAKKTHAPPPPSKDERPRDDKP